MSDPTIVPAGGGEVVGDAPDRRVEILADHDALAATWSRFGPRREGADLHIHYEHTDLFYVLDGELTFRLGTEDRQVPLSAGTLVRVPIGVVHGFRNASDAQVRYLNLHAPGRRFADYLRGMRDRRPFPFDQHDPPADGGRPISEVVVSSEGPRVDRDGLPAELLCDAETITVARVTGEPGGSRPAPHAHEDRVEWLYVLEGEMTVHAGGRELALRSGGWAEIPAGVEHALVPVSAVMFLELHTPTSGG